MYILATTRAARSGAAAAGLRVPGAGCHWGHAAGGEPAAAGAGAGGHGASGGCVGHTCALRWSWRWVETGDIF